MIEPPSGMHVPIPPEFEKLRDMDAFSDDMLNRIIAFQEKEHSAWNAARPFAERLQIRGLNAGMRADFSDDLFKIQNCDKPLLEFGDTGSDAFFTAINNTVRLFDLSP
jgi:hypothetical protein